MLKQSMHIAWWLGVSLYFGGLVTLGAIVAPAVFTTSADAHLSMVGIASPPLDMGRQVGGEIFGAALNRFAWVELLSLGLMLIGLMGMILLHKPARRSSWTLFILWILLTGCAAYDTGMLRPKVWELRTEVRNSAAAHLAATAPWAEQTEFDRLHEESELLGRTKVYLLLAMIVVAAWRRLADRPTIHRQAAGTARS
jgi:hypothetical protein